MKELSLNVLDIAQNSIKAEATLVEIALKEKDGWLSLTVTDDGYGMEEELLLRVTDPFSTTRTTRKVGMGIPLLKLAAEQTGGTLSIRSTPKSKEEVAHGTTVTATFDMGHVDFTPIGDIVSTVVLLIQGSPDIDFRFTHERANGTVCLDTREMRMILGEEVPLDDFAVLEWTREMLTEQYASEEPIQE